ncbi:GNAT family N-acetyltransferase [Brucepastera parasyntrophica]|uniref:GNAT family N-acetyltransferase n=1 Tax=Brucepastera parasyntrophica TaxID=2880008 RepID=UPI00210CD6E0|nr:GNAT family N-acetyltransferase [Brucepastera parasyntrophica]ULQ59774.1 GNAT family N-acetyltransferase [Brucepastera parasyntrophica]
MEHITEISDSGRITEIVNKAFMTVARQFNYTKENASHFPVFAEKEEICRQLESGLKMYGYVKDDEIIACIGYSYQENQKYLIERLATLPEYRHLGIGTKLLDFAEQKIRDRDGKTAEVHIVDNNKVLKVWYKKLSYKESRIEAPAFYHLKYV